MGHLRRAVLLAGLLALGAFACPLRAQQAPEIVQARVLELLERETSGLPGTVSIEISPLDPANLLPPCAALEAFLPAGTRAWGRISVGVRCDSPVVWTVYLQAQVAVAGSYLVSARPLRAGQIVGPEDVELRNGDLTALPANTLTDGSMASGRTTRFAIAAGQPLRGDMLRIPHAVRQGQNVQVVSIGSGFQIESEGRALNNAGPGESVRVRLMNGQTVSGVARPDGIVEVRF